MTEAGAVAICASLCSKYSWFTPSLTVGARSNWFMVHHPSPFVRLLSSAA